MQKVLKSLRYFYLMKLLLNAVHMMVIVHIFEKLKFLGKNFLINSQIILITFEFNCFLLICFAYFPILLLSWPSLNTNIQTFFINIVQIINWLNQNNEYILREYLCS